MDQNQHFLARDQEIIKEKSNYPNLKGEETIDYLLCAENWFEINNRVHFLRENEEKETIMDFRNEY